MNPLIETVRTIWERRGIQNRSAATKADILAFEGKYGITLAPIVRDYFCELNGTNIGECGMEDENLMGFWHLDQVRSMSEECPWCVTDEPKMFIFADYSIWALGYAIRLATPDDGSTAVFRVGERGELTKRAHTFEEFLHRYAVGDQNVLFGSNEAEA